MVESGSLGRGWVETERNAIRSPANSGRRRGDELTVREDEAPVLDVDQMVEPRALFVAQ